MENQTQQPAAATIPPVSAPAQPAATPAPATPPVKKSSKLGLVLGVFAVLLLAGGGWFGYQYYMNKSSQGMYQGAYKDSTEAPTVTPSPTIGAVKSGDAELDEQSDTIDDELDKVNTDVNDVDQGLQDKAPDLSQ